MLSMVLCTLLTSVTAASVQVNGDGSSNCSTNLHNGVDPDFDELFDEESNGRWDPISLPELVACVKVGQSPVNLTASNQQACYKQLGCFKIPNGTFPHINKLPMPPAELGCKFSFFDRANRDKGILFNYSDVTALNHAFGEKVRPIVIIVHGFQSNSSVKWVLDMKNAVLDLKDARVILVSWDKGAKLPAYQQAVVNTELVGRIIARGLWNLAKRHPRAVDFKQVHFVGHSLGAQVGRFFADYLYDISSSKGHKGRLIGRLTGLDPAQPCYEKFKIYVNKSSAEFVDIVHTASGSSDLSSLGAGRFGMKKPVGHLDFYLNGGSKQPGCDMFHPTCSHSRAHSYYNWALRKQKERLDHHVTVNKDTCFVAFACKGGLKEITQNKCTKIPKKWNVLTLDQSDKLSGRGPLLLDTTKTPPYCYPGTKLATVVHIQSGTAATISKAISP